MEDDAVRRDGASSDAPSDHDCEVVHAPGVGTSPAAHEARAPTLGHLPGDPFVGAEERRFWEAFHDLLLTLRDTGSRAKGVLHALAPHCLAPFKRITPEVVNGASLSPRARGPRAGPPVPRKSPVVNAGTVFAHDGQCDRWPSLFFRRSRRRRAATVLNKYARPPLRQRPNAFPRTN